MPSNEDNKQTEFPKNENSKETKKTASKKEAVVVTKKKRQHSIGWFIGVIVLILISITFVLPVSLVGVSGGSAITFGSYNGKKINFEATADNYFYNQYSSLVQSATDTSSLQAVYQIWNQAFNNTVFFTAIDEMAKDAKIIAAQSVIDDTIRSSFTNDEGEFDAETYSSLDSATRAAIRQNAEQAVPAQIVLSDMTTVLTSDAESEAVASQGDVGRTFNYVVVDATAYPEDKVKEYAEANPQPFTSVEISMLTVETEEAATEQLNAITAGEKTFADVAKEVSLDGYKENGGEVGRTYYYQFQNIIANEDDLNKIFAAKEGDIVGPIAMNSGYSLFQVTKGVTLPVMDEQDILAVQSYLNTNDSELISSFTKAKADELYQEAQGSSLTDAADKLGLEAVAVTATSQNIGASSLLPTFAYTDSVGALSSASADETYYTTLYTEDTGSVLAPQQVSNAYIVTEVGEDQDTSAGTAFIEAYWPTIASSLTQSDLQNMIFGSDNFDNQFMTVFFDQIYNLGSN